MSRISETLVCVSERGFIIFGHFFGYFSDFRTKLSVTAKSGTFVRHKVRHPAKFGVLCETLRILLKSDWSAMNAEHAIGSRWPGARQVEVVYPLGDRKAM